MSRPQWGLCVPDLRGDVLPSSTEGLTGRRKGRPRTSLAGAPLPLFIQPLSLFFLVHFLRPLIRLPVLSSIHPSLPPLLPLAASTLLPFLLSLSLPGVVAMAREPAQMAGQLAFRGRAPQLKLPPSLPPPTPPFLLLSSSAQTFGLQLFTSGKPLSRRA